jgi:hypothetical protein
MEIMEVMHNTATMVIMEDSGHIYRATMAVPGLIMAVGIIWELRVTTVVPIIAE